MTPSLYPRFRSRIRRRRAANQVCGTSYWILPSAFVIPHVTALGEPDTLCAAKARGNAISALVHDAGGLDPVELRVPLVDPRRPAGRHSRLVVAWTLAVAGVEVGEDGP